MSAPSFKTGLAREGGALAVAIVLENEDGDAYVALTPDQAEAIARSLLDLARQARIGISEVLS